MFPDGYNLSEGNVKISQNEYTETLENGLKRVIKETGDYIRKLEETIKHQEKYIDSLENCKDSHEKCIDSLVKELEKRGCNYFLPLGRSFQDKDKKEE